MYDVVTLLFEEGGRPIPRYQLAFEQAEYEGYYSFKQSYWKEVRRTWNIARLVDEAGRDVIPPLYDAKQLHYERGETRLTGLQYDEVTRKYVAQTWHVKLAGYCPWEHPEVPPAE